MQIFFFDAYSTSAYECGGAAAVGISIRSLSMA